MLFAFVFAALLQTAELELGGKTIQVEIADTPDAREKGLMGRKSLADGHGVLFVFDEPSLLSFWMKDVLIPLSIGFFDADRTLIRTAEMKLPRPEASTFPSYESGAPAQYALEAPENWFKKNRIKPGMKFSLHDQGG